MAVEAREATRFAELLTGLSDLGPPSELRRQGVALAAGALDFDRVLLTGVEGGRLTAQGLHPVDARGELLASLRAVPVELEYPLVEGEVLRRRRAQVVRASDATGHGLAFDAVLGWTEYAVAPIVLDSAVIGFFHADRQASGRSVGDDDAEALRSFALCFAVVYERAVLRHRLRVQRQELRQVANWAQARTSAFGDRPVSLGDEQASVSDEQADRALAVTQPSDAGERALGDLLTRRELDVLRLMVRGETNAGIARELVVSEGTVKFHVKNVLRKLHASNRAEATSRYLRLTLGRER